jgi:CMP-N,N'-diacetyllegionaminic acid synthase
MDNREMKPKILGLIPARGGSKGIPDKNIRPLAGIPLLEYSRRAAVESGMIDRLVLSTDSLEIAALGKKIGLEVPFLRPPELAQDDTPMLPVIQHTISYLEDQNWLPDIIVLLQPTAPLRKPQHIINAVRLLILHSYDAVVSVVEVPRHFSPDFVFKIDNERLLNFLPEGQRVTRRQDARQAYYRDGSVYTFWLKTLKESGNIYGDWCHPLIIQSEESVNLDSQEDWDRAESILRRSFP